MLKANAFVLTSLFLVSLPIFALAQSDAHQHSAQSAWPLTLHSEGRRPKICLADPQETSSFKQGARQGGHGISQQQPAYPDEIACQNAVEAGRAGLAMSDNMIYIRQAESHAYSQVPLYQVVGARVDSVKMAQLSPDSQTMALVFQHQGQSQLNFVHTKSMRPQYKPVTLKVGLQNPKAFIFSKPQPAFANGSTVALHQQPSNLGILVGESRMARVVAAGDNLSIVDSPAVPMTTVTKKLKPYQPVARVRPSDAHRPASNKAYVAHQANSPDMIRAQAGKKLRHARHVPYTNNSSPYMMQVIPHGTRNSAAANPDLHQDQPRFGRKAYSSDVFYVISRGQQSVSQSIGHQ